MQIFYRRFTLLLTACFFVAACGGGDSNYDTLADAYPYLSDEKYSDNLKKCAIVETGFGSCSLNRMPTIGMDNPQPSIANIMERLVVSHDWMGERFEQLLNTLPSDIIQLFGAVTVITIDADTRPSEYNGVTGAIYLDPASLWMTQDEKSSISTKEDYRSGNQTPLAFRIYTRSTKDGEPAFKWYGLNSTDNRPFEDMILPMASLLYHELAHANDHLPANGYETIDKSRTIKQVTDSLKDSYASTLLAQEYPLTSKGMRRMGPILFRGATPTQADTEVTATEMGAFFASDAAVETYGYASKYEDVATLFQRAMMKIHFDVDYDFAFVEAKEGINGDDRVIGWGVRNRIGDHEVKKRVQFVVEKLLPNADYSDFFESLPPPVMLPNIAWGDSLTLD